MQQVLSGVSLNIIGPTSSRSGGEPQLWPHARLLRGASSSAVPPVYHSRPGRASTFSAQQVLVWEASLNSVHMIGRYTAQAPQRYVPCTTVVWCVLGVRQTHARWPWLNLVSAEGEPSRVRISILLASAMKMDDVPCATPITDACVLPRS